MLYAGLMLTEAGPKVVEFNCRWRSRDPALLPQWSDLAGALAVGEGRLSSYRP